MKQRIGMEGPWPTPYTPQPNCPVPMADSKPEMKFTHDRIAPIILLLLIVVSVGCVRRRMTIRSNPPGAMVYVDDQQIGQTPVSTGFTYYGTRDVTLVRDGYETLSVKHTFDRPWYQTPPLDFVSENLTVREIRDERILDFTLVPQRMVSSEELWRSAESLRQSAQQGYIAPLPLAPRGDATLIGSPPPSLGAPSSSPLPLNGPVAPTSDAGHRGPWR